MNALLRMCMPFLLLAYAGGAFADVYGPTAEDAEASDTIAMSLTKGCVTFAGDASRLRDWLVSEHLRSTQADEFKPFLMGYDGVVYTIHTSLGGIAVTSLDNGGCSVFFSHINQDGFVTRFTSWIRSTYVVEHSERKITGQDEKNMTHFYEYDIEKNAHRRRVVLSTVPPGGVAEIILSAYGM